MSGTDFAFAMQSPVLTTQLLGTDYAIATGLLRDVRYLLRICYAMSGTDCGTRSEAELTELVKELIERYLSLIHISEPTRPRLI
eukprot:741520-Rhodomonas_salina.1